MPTSCPFYGGSREIGVAAGAANLRGGAEGTNYGVTVIKLLSRSTDVSSVVRLPPSSGDLLRREIHIGLGKTCPSKFAFFCGSLSLSVENGLFKGTGIFGRHGYWMVLYIRFCEGRGHGGCKVKTDCKTALNCMAFVFRTFG